MAKKSAPTPAPTIEALESSAIRSKPLVFISHDSRDADLAEAFSNLLIDVSGGTLKSFRSSDKKGTSGIEFGSEWYTTIMSRLDEATDVVALLTQSSIERPWILYEAGVAKGKLDTTVLGLAAGVPLSDVSTGPFGQFQNCADDQDSLTKLVVQLLKRNPDASPREEAVRQQVESFILKKDEIISSIKTTQKKKPEVGEEDNIAKLFEEIKAMLRDVHNQSMNNNVMYRQDKMIRRIPSGLIEDMLMGALKFPDCNSLSMLMIVASLIRDDAPWLYEPIIELYRTTTRGIPQEIERAYDNLIDITKLVSRGLFEKYLYRMNGHRMMIVQEIIRAIEVLFMKRGLINKTPPSRRRNNPGEVNREKQ